MKFWREWPLTLCLIVVAFAGLFAISCRLLPVKQLPPIPAGLTAERDPYLAPQLQTNVLAVPTPPGAPALLLTNVVLKRASLVMNVVLPPAKPVVRSFAGDYAPYHGPLNLLAVCATATNLDGPWTVIGSTAYPSNGATLTLNLTNGAARKFARFGWAFGQ